MQTDLGMTLDLAQLLLAVSELALGAIPTGTLFLPAAAELGLIETELPVVCTRTVAAVGAGKIKSGDSVHVDGSILGLSGSCGESGSVLWDSASHGSGKFRIIVRVCRRRVEAWSATKTGTREGCKAWRDDTLLKQRNRGSIDSILVVGTLAKGRRNAGCVVCRRGKRCIRVLRLNGLLCGCEFEEMLLLESSKVVERRVTCGQLREVCGSSRRGEWH